jgi:hypothetical protein
MTSAYVRLLNDVDFVQVNLSEYDKIMTDILETLRGYSPRNVVSILVDLLKDKASGLSSKDRSKRLLQAKTSRVYVSESSKSHCFRTDVQLMRFIEFYCQCIAPQDALFELYGLVVVQIKDYVAQANQFRHVFLASIRVLTVILLNLPPSHMEDRRFKKDTLVRPLHAQFDIVRICISA